MNIGIDIPEHVLEITTGILLYDVLRTAVSRLADFLRPRLFRFAYPVQPITNVYNTYCECCEHCDPKDEELEKEEQAAPAVAAEPVQSP